MTNEQIDALEGKKLDAAMDKAFLVYPRGSDCLEYSNSFDRALGVLRDDLSKDFAVGTTRPGCKERYWAGFFSPGEGERAYAEGPRLATALCRAALKAKAAEPEGVTPEWFFAAPAHMASGWVCPTCGCEHIKVGGDLVIRDTHYDLECGKCKRVQVDDDEFQPDVEIHRLQADNADLRMKLALVPLKNRETAGLIEDEVRLRAENAELRAALNAEFKSGRGPRKVDDMELDDQPIKGITLSLPGYAWYGVGNRDVEKITLGRESGQMAAVPWFEVWKNGKIWRRVNAAMVEEVHYDDE